MNAVVDTNLVKEKAVPDAPIRNPPLFVYATNQFAGDGTLYWSGSNHAWGCLSSADIYTMDERKTVRDAGEDRREYTHRNTGNVMFLPTEGEFHELPDLLKLKSIEEWLRDID